MKKILAYCLSAAMLLGLAACGAPDASPAAESSAAAPAAAEAAAPETVPETKAAETAAAPAETAAAETEAAAAETEAAAEAEAPAAEAGTDAAEATPSEAAAEADAEAAGATPSEAAAEAGTEAAAAETEAAEGASGADAAAAEATTSRASFLTGEYEEIFSDWNDGAPALQKLIDYVGAVTDETSPDFIPEADRIAVFDMDGTLYGELYPTYLEYYMLAWRILKDPTITPDEEMLSLGRELRESVLTHSFASDMPIRHAIQAARAYSGMTLKEFAAFVNSILIRDVDGFEGMTYGTAFYLPMIQVIDYLEDNGFKVYVCSGSDRFICRTLLEGMIDVPYENIIGMDVAFEATNQDGADGLDYVFTAADDVVRTDRLLIKNLKMNKVLQIVQEIGHQPVLSFGNSSGDVSMHMYTISNNPYRSEAFMLIADDEERDYGNTEKTRQLGEKWEASGFNVISMKDDFRTIYGDDVVKTGSFRWAEELSEDRVPAEFKGNRAEAEPEAAEAEVIEAEAEMIEAEAEVIESEVIEAEAEVIESEVTGALNARSPLVLKN